MDRIIGIDYGKKRTGVAMSDPLMMFASPIETVQTANIIDYLKKMSLQESIVRFVVGYPMNMDNKPSEAAADVEVFLKQLRKAFPDIPVTLEDERFTSVLAHRSLIDSGVKKMARRDKAAVDKVSAALILQTFLDRKTD
ncbi:MAG: Holliday junction resolvase RuvX [Bacteroidales bacterium]|jgi:putative Holliday junction resolvase|nr:Holliday junction resolvase RuvX [Bacteroidales bacterium]MBR3526213.1 Holliday junction resolvase RuvX [Bacteroidales bacterium]